MKSSAHGFSGLLVSVEGVDLVGKTVLASGLSRLPNWRFFSTPSEPFRSIRQQVEDLRDLDTRFFYYLASVIAAQCRLKELLAAGSNVVIDRYIDSTFVMHAALGVNTGCVDRSALPILQADLTLVLTADRETRIRRRLERDHQPSHDLQIEQSLQLTDRAQELFQELGHPIIDTTRADKERVRGIAIGHIDEVQHAQDT